jgi:hypothetical protein
METGCIFDNHRGIYMGQAIIELAKENGFILQCPEDGTPEGEFYCEAWIDAEDYLNDNLAEEGFAFGASEQGDFMYMSISWWEDEN